MCQHVTTSRFRIAYAHATNGTMIAACTGNSHSEAPLMEIYTLRVDDGNTIITTIKASSLMQAVLLAARYSNRTPYVTYSLHNEYGEEVGTFRTS